MHQSCMCVAILCSLLSLASADESSAAYYYQFSVCDDSKVLVEEISLLCDSPGAYYYGSGKYRNSAKCEPGDKAKLYIGIKILEDLEQDDAYIDLQVQAYGSVETQVIASKASLCSTLVSKDDSIACPQPGYYEISDRFYWSGKDENDNYEYSFIPKVVIGISSTEKSNVYDFGGANTNHCYGNTFNTWTSGVKRTAADTVASFFFTFGILMGTIFAVLLAGVCIYRQAQKQRQRREKIIVDEEFDEAAYQNLASMVAAQKDLVTVA